MKKLPTLNEVIYTRHYETNPARASVTRTVLQLDVDMFEMTKARPPVGINSVMLRTSRASGK